MGHRLPLESVVGKDPGEDDRPWTGRADSNRAEVGAVLLWNLRASLEWAGFWASRLGLKIRLRRDEPGFLSRRFLVERSFLSRRARGSRLGVRHVVPLHRPGTCEGPWHSVFRKKTRHAGPLSDPDFPKSECSLWILLHFEVQLGPYARRIYKFHSFQSRAIFPLIGPKWQGLHLSIHSLFINPLSKRLERGAHPCRPHVELPGTVQSPASLGRILSRFPPIELLAIAESSTNKASLGGEPVL